MAAPLSQLLTKEEFAWTPEAADAFQNLKTVVTNSPVLALPDFTKSFVVEIDASGSGMGAVLSQGRHPIAFFSKQFCPKLLSSSTYVRELAAITTVVKKWRQYLLGHHFVIFTDHRSLKELMSQTIQTPEQHRYLARLVGFDYSIQYRTGKTNVVVDALSRCSELPSASFFILSMPHFVFLEDLYKELQSHNKFITLREEVHANPTAYPDHVLTPNFVLHRGRIWLPSYCTFIKALLTKFHQTPTGGHMGFRKTLNRVAKNFTWRTMSSETRKFVAHCVDCQLVKYEPAKPRGLLCPLPVPSQPWKDLSMDFIVGLLAYCGNTCILVIVDHFLKRLHLGMLPSHHTAQSVAQLFMELRQTPRHAQEHCL